MTAIFKCEGVIFTRHVVDDGQRYEWQSADGKLYVGRNEGRSTCWARTNGRACGQSFLNLKLAMQAAAQAQWRAAA